WHAGVASRGLNRQPGCRRGRRRPERMPGQVIASFLRPFAQHLRHGGKDPLEVARRLGLADPEKAGRDWLSRAQVRAYLEEAALELRDPNLGLSVARARPRGTYGLVEFGTRSAPDLRAAFEFTI